MEISDQSLQSSFEKLQSLRTGMNSLLVLILLGLALFLYKILQTSNFSLTFSSLAHHQMGVWIFALSGLSVLWFVINIVFGAKAKSFTEEREKYSAILKDELASAKDKNDTRRAIDLEAKLRKAEAMDTPKPWS